MLVKHHSIGGSTFSVQAVPLVRLQAVDRRALYSLGLVVDDVDDFVATPAANRLQTSQISTCLPHSFSRPNLLVTDHKPSTTTYDAIPLDLLKSENLPIMPFQMAQRSAQSPIASAARLNISRDGMRPAAPALPQRMLGAGRQQPAPRRRDSPLVRAVETEKPKVDPAKPEVAMIADSIGKCSPPHLAVLLVHERRH